MNVRHSFIIALFLLIAYGLNAQERFLEGKVLDMATREPLAGAIVAATNEDGRVLGYSVADEQGVFKVAAPENTKSLVATLLGYEKKSIQAPFVSPLIISMSAGRERIASAIITSRNVQVQGDTISYSAAAVRGKNDRNLGDLLERLPGIEVSRSGGILYNGTPINRLYIEGRDILKGEYNFASSNLDAKSIRSIDIYRNHQPVKVLRDIVETNSAALNITLEDFAKGSWSGLLDAAGGHTWMPEAAWSGSLLGVYIGRTDASMNKANTNNTGTLPYLTGTQSNVIRIGEEQFNRYALRNYFASTVDEAPLEDIHGALNHSVSAQTINNHAFSEDTNIGLTVKYSRDQLASTYTGTRQYLLPGEAAEQFYQDINEKETIDSFLSASVDIVTNTNRRYLKNVLYFDLQRSSGQTKISSPGGLMQNAGNKRIDINNILDCSFRVSKQSVIRVANYTQYTSKTESLHVSQNELEQFVASRAFYNSFALSGIARTTRQWSFSLSPRLVLFWRHLGSRLTGLLPDEIPGARVQDMSVLSVQPVVGVDVDRRMGQWQIGIRATGAYRYYAFRAQETWRQSLPTISGIAFVKYARGRVETSLTYTYQLGVQDEQTIGQALILCSYNALRSGHQTLAQTPLHQLQLNLGYNEPWSGIYFRLNSSVERGNAVPEVRTLFDEYVLQQESDRVTEIQTVFGSLSLSKGLSLLRGKIDAGVSYDRSCFRLLQNGADVDYVTSALQASLTFKTNPFRWLGLEYAGKYTVTNFAVSGGDEPSRRDFRQAGSVSFLPGNKWEVRVSAEHLLNIVSSVQGIVLVDADVSWRIMRQVRLYLQGVNLLNQREYVLVTTSPLLVSSTSWRIRPRMLLLGLEWKF